MDEYLSRAVCLSILRAKANMTILMGAAPYFEAAALMLEKLPAADVAPVVHGKDLASPSLFHCSVCGCEDDDTYTCDVSEYRYCPNCGAKMDEREGTQ